MLKTNMLADFAMKSTFMNAEQVLGKFHVEENIKKKMADAQAKFYKKIESINKQCSAYEDVKEAEFQEVFKNIERV